MQKRFVSNDDGDGLLFHLTWLVRCCFYFFLFYFSWLCFLLESVIGACYVKGHFFNTLTTINKRLFMLWHKMSLANISAKIFLVGLLLEELQKIEFQSIGTNFSQFQTKQNINKKKSSKKFHFWTFQWHWHWVLFRETFSFRLTVSKMINLCVLVMNEHVNRRTQKADDNKIRETKTSFVLYEKEMEIFEEKVNDWIRREIFVCCWTWREEGEREKDLAQN